MDLLETIGSEFHGLTQLETSDALKRVERKIYPLLPGDDSNLLDLLDRLMSTGDGRNLWLATVWAKRRALYRLEYMPRFEGWLYNHTDRWGRCDILCYRVLSPMVETYPQLFEAVLRWTESSGTYVRRAAPVSLLRSHGTFSVHQDWDRVRLVAEKLKNDREIHVQKGVGWLLKYAYLRYPEEVARYLQANVGNLPRVIFRYALEKAPESTREELMSL